MTEHYNGHTKPEWDFLNLEAARENEYMEEAYRQYQEHRARRDALLERMGLIRRIGRTVLQRDESREG